jgi:hypothetical protein
MRVTNSIPLECRLHLTVRTFYAVTPPKALEWLESNRAVMDAEHVASGWFLSYHSNGSVFNHPVTIPVDATKNITLRQYFIDWRNMDAAE